MKSAYTRVADISKHALSVNLVVKIERESFTEFFPKNDGLDHAVGEVVIGDGSGTVTMLVTNRHLVALGMADGSEQHSVVILRNVLPAIVCGRLRIELNRFSSVCGRHVEGLAINMSNNVSLVDYDILSKVGG